jgi:hypothetical protein
MADLGRECQRTRGGAYTAFRLNVAGLSHSHEQLTDISIGGVARNAERYGVVIQKYPQ